MTYLGSGTYGCVFSPPLQCKKHPNEKQQQSSKHVVGKVFINKHAFQDEYKNFKYMTEFVDKRSEFTVHMKAECIVKPTTLNAPTDKCTTFKGTEHQIIYPNHGDDLLIYAQNNHGNVKAFLKLVKALAPVFKGLETMARAQVIHSDIKPANMLYNPVQKRVVLIDYGLVTPFKDILGPSHNSIKGATYMYFPLEFKLVHNRKISTKQLADLLDKAHGGKAHTFFDTLDINISNELSRLVSQNSKDTRIIPEKIDVYSLGITIAEIMHMMLPTEGVKFTRYDKIKLALIKNMIRDMVRLNPAERLNPKEIARIYRKIVGMI